HAPRAGRGARGGGRGGPMTRFTHLIERARADLRARHVPLRATYRLQFLPGRFGFADARDLVEYLDRLGVSHLYAAPHLRCRPGSTHGYDVVDHLSVNLELGTEEELAELHE